MGETKLPNFEPIALWDDSLFQSAAGQDSVNAAKTSRKNSFYKTTANVLLKV